MCLSPLTRELHRNQIHPGASNDQSRIRIHAQTYESPQLPRRPSREHSYRRPRGGDNRGDTPSGSRELETRGPCSCYGTGPQPTIHDAQNRRWRGTKAAHLRESQLSGAKPSSEVCVLVSWAIRAGVSARSVSRSCGETPPAKEE